MNRLAALLVLLLLGGVAQAGGFEEEVIYRDRSLHDWLADLRSDDRAVRLRASRVLRLVDAMQRRPRIGLIQTAPTITNAGSVFARMSQFGVRMYGRVAAAGLAWWAGAEGTRPEIRALVEHAFQVDKEGRINRSALFALRRLDITDPQWLAAMRALSDAIRVISSKEYVRFYRRKDAKSPWHPIVIDLAGVS